MRFALIPLVAAPLFLAAAPASAQSDTMGARTAYAAIEAGKYDKAERVLLGELKIYPDRPELLLNLAAVYARTGRDAEARALYRKVLDHDDVPMNLGPDRTIGSHAVARTSLHHMDAVASK